MEQTKPHHGRNIKRFREWFDIKQETLASELNWSQQKVSLLEQKEEIEDSVLEEVAKILKVPVDAIKKLDDPLSFVNNFNDNSINHGPLNNYNCTFNLVDKVVELYDEKIALYERMLKDKESMIEELKKMLSK
jgi:transcriptional regulator with XRE-family HTH domain